MYIRLLRSLYKRIAIARTLLRCLASLAILQILQGLLRCPRHLRFYSLISLRQGGLQSPGVCPCLLLQNRAPLSAKCGNGARHNFLWNFWGAVWVDGGNVRHARYRICGGATIRYCGRRLSNCANCGTKRGFSLRCASVLQLYFRHLNGRICGYRYRYHEWSLSNCNFYVYTFFASGAKFC